MEQAEKVSECADHFLLCCMCKNLLRDPLQLQCLHNCCRQCLGSATDNGNCKDVTCPACSLVSQAGSAESNSFVDYSVRCYTSMAETKLCTICKNNGDANVFALVWCGACRQSLCGDCISAHKRYNRNHCTQSLDELTNFEDVLPKISLPSCLLHNRPLEVVCFTCEKAKCLNCWALCNDMEHKMGLFNDKSFEDRLRHLKTTISSSEEELVTRSEVFQECKSLLSDLQFERENHLESIQRRKRRVMEAVDCVYLEIEHSTKNMYDSLQTEAERMSAVAANLEANVNFSRKYVRRLLESNSSCDLWNQQRSVLNHFKTMSAELDKLNTLITEAKYVSIEPSLPENLEYVLRSWIGEPRIFSATIPPPRRSHLFCSLSGCIQMPFECLDIALTQDQRIFLAAGEHGLLEFCTTGHELSRWQPPKQTSGDDDEVEFVQALSDGRVAVGIFYAKHVALLRRMQDKTWMVDRSIDGLKSPPLTLSVQGDVLAVGEGIFDAQQNFWNEGRELQLISLSSGDRRALLSREYEIRSIAVTDLVIITSSDGMVTLDEGRKAYVLDAHKLSNDERLWRFEVSGED